MSNFVGVRWAMVGIVVGVGVGVGNGCGAAWGGVADWGYEWSVIGDAGNRDWNASEAPVQVELRVFRGGVDYEYRLAKTEVTVGEWFEFVEAYLPYADVDTFSVPAFGGQFILFAPDGSGAGIVGPADAPANMSWEYAARYCNWLHNGKVSEEWAFESGAYDTSTFTQNPDGTWNHQATRSEGARFWIPSFDEWVKGAHWDPEKDGGAGGYWGYVGGGDEPLQPGQPAEGGETNAGANGIYGDMPIEVASYPEVGPWGMFDMSGGEQEWLEDLASADGSSRLQRTSRRHSPNEFSDRVFNAGGSPFGLGSAGLRLASAVPSGGTIATIGVAGCLISFRRRTGLL